MFLVIVETNGAISNRDTHVGRPLARIVAQAFEFALKAPHKKRTVPSDVPVMFGENTILEEGVLVAITVRSEYSPNDVSDMDTLHERIAGSIHQSGMFNCRNAKGEVRLELQLDVRFPVAQAA